MLEIQSYTLADLRQRLYSDDFWCGDVIPITKQRALSHINNPRARPEDLALLVAYDDDRVVGHIGVLPDSVFLKSEKRRIGWLTAWWADPNPKYAGVGLMLMVKALKAYEGQVGASGFSLDAKKAYEASKLFLETQETIRLKVLLRLSAREALPRKFPFLKRVGLLLGVLDLLLNTVCELRLRLWHLRNRASKQIRLEYLAEVDSETTDFVEKLQANELSRRGPAEITWIARNPWILSTPVGEMPPQEFYFSATARQTDCFMVKVLDSDRAMLGFVMLRLIDGHLTVPLFYAVERGAREVFHVVAEHAIALRAHTLTLGRKILRHSLAEAKLPHLASIRQSTRWILGTAYGKTILEDYELQDGDGDCAFWS